MDDYIKREDAIQSVMNHDILKSDWSRAWAEYMLEDAPTADVAPVRHGHWIKITPSGIYECSKCGKYVMTCDIEAYKYCQICGARMDGDNNAFI